MTNAGGEAVRGIKYTGECFIPHIVSPESRRRMDRIVDDAFSMWEAMRKAEKPDPATAPEPELLHARCRGCGGVDLYDDHAEGDLVCTDCGLVAASHMPEDTAEWINNLEEGLDRSRVGAPMDPYFIDGALSTMIGGPGGPKYGRHKLMFMLQQQMSMTYRDRSLYKVFKLFQELAEKIHMPEAAVNSAKEMYRDVKMRKIVRGENHRAIMACCVYYGLKITPGAYREKNDVCVHFSVDKSAMSAACKQFMSILADRPYIQKIQESETHSMRGAISRLVSQLQLAHLDALGRFKLTRAVEDAYDLMRAKDDGELDSKTPHSLLTALLCREGPRLGHSEVTKELIKEKCGVSVLTLTRTLAIIERVLASS